MDRGRTCDCIQLHLTSSLSLTLDFVSLFLWHDNSYSCDVATVVDVGCHKEHRSRGPCYSSSDLRVKMSDIQKLKLENMWL